MKNFHFFAVLLIALSSSSLFTSCETKTPPRGYVSCPECGGDGYVWPNRIAPIWFIPGKCLHCGGDGYCIDNHFKQNNRSNFRGGSGTVYIYDISGTYLGKGHYNSHNNTVSFLSVDWDVVQSNSSRYDYQLKGWGGSRNYYFNR